MKKRIALILLAIPLFLFAEESGLKTLQYRVGAWTKFDSPTKETPKVVDPFSKEAQDAWNPAPPTDSLEGYIAYALDIQITNENGKYLFFDGEAIFARIDHSEHKQLEKALKTKGSEVTKEEEIRVLESLEQRKIKPNKSQ